MTDYTDQARTAYAARLAEDEAAFEARMEQLREEGRRATERTVGLFAILRDGLLDAADTLGFAAGGRGLHQAAGAVDALAKLILDDAAAADAYDAEQCARRAQTRAHRHAHENGDL